MKPRMASIALGQGRGTTPFPGTPSPKTKPGRLHKRIDTPVKREKLHQFLPESLPFGLPSFNLSQGLGLERGSTLLPVEN